MPNTVPSAWKWAVAGVLRALPLAAGTITISTGSSNLTGLKTSSCQVVVAAWKAVEADAK